MKRLPFVIVPLLAIVLSVYQLESARSGIAFESLSIAGTPATYSRLASQPSTESAPVIIVAHGFAGSRQIMSSFTLTLARAGYELIAFDFEGHGRNPVPMSGDVTSVDGTTRLLVEETRRVVAAVRQLRGDDVRIGLLGHSMATDVLLRVAIAESDVGRPVDTIVGISIFSETITATVPSSLLMINGQWEGRLRAPALKQLQLIDPLAKEGETARNGDVVRRVVVAPYVEHVSVLYSAVAMRETLDWMDMEFSRQSNTKPVSVGGWILLLLAGIVLAFKSVIHCLPEKKTPTEKRVKTPVEDLSEQAMTAHAVERIEEPSGKPTQVSTQELAQESAQEARQGLIRKPIAPQENELTEELSTRMFLFSVTIPTCLTPVLAVMPAVTFLPVLVADYLMLHLAVFAVLQLFVFKVARYTYPVSRFSTASVLLGASALALWGIAVFGLALDRYAASYLPTSGRLTIVAVLCLGTMIFMVADSIVTGMGRGRLWRRLFARFAFLVSLGIAAAIDPERLIFLLLIFPVLILFYLVHGLMGRWVAQRCGPIAAGVGLGLCLAWSLGVSFPLFET